VLGQLGSAARAFPEAQASALEEMATGERDTDVLATVACAFGHLGEPYGLDALLALREHPAAEVREGVAFGLGGRRDQRALDALIDLSRDPHARVRDWATFALGTLAPQDTPELRDALAARLDDEHPETRLEAVHGLALRGDARAAEPALALLADAGGDDRGIWPRHLLRETAARLAELTGDPRFTRWARGD
jgi:HEAT repeat protein